MTDIVESHRDELDELCRRYGVKSLDLFGSGANAHFSPPTSDLDFLVEFEDMTPEDAADRYFGLLIDLEVLFRRKVDLVTKRSIRNPYFRKAVERSRVPLYAT